MVAIESIAVAGTPAAAQSIFPPLVSARGSACYFDEIFFEDVHKFKVLL
jgi:hypothetical protein